MWFDRKHPVAVKDPSSKRSGGCFHPVLYLQVLQMIAPLAVAAFLSAEWLCSHMLSLDSPSDLIQVWTVVLQPSGGIIIISIHPLHHSQHYQWLRFTPGEFRFTPGECLNTPQHGWLTSSPIHLSMAGSLAVLYLLVLKLPPFFHQLQLVAKELLPQCNSQTQWFNLNNLTFISIMTTAVQTNQDKQWALLESL